MADPTPTPTPTPAPAPTPTAGTFNRDMLVPVKVDHELRMEPLGKVIDSFQIQSAAEKRMIAANQLKQHYEQQAQVLGQKAASWDQLEAGLIENPRATLQEIARAVAMKTGQRIDLGGEPNTDSEGHEGTTPTRSPDPEVATLKRKVTELERAHTSANVQAAIAQAVSEYPLFVNSPEARRQAERFIASALVANPQANPRDLASDVHADLAKIANTQAAATLQQRTQDATQLATVPAGSGTPAMLDQEPPPTYADWKSGKAMPRLKAHFDRVMTAARNGRT